jgi:hypothetical protein
MSKSKFWEIEKSLVENHETITKKPFNSFFFYHAYQVSSAELLPGIFWLF